MLPAERITELLRAWSSGDEDALRAVIPLTYGELRNIATSCLRGRQPDAALDTAALINETYLRLTTFAEVEWSDRRHFLAVCAQLMRRILVDQIRATKAQKRGGSWAVVTLNDGHIATDPVRVDLLALNEALNALEKLDARKVRVIELRFFAGFEVRDTAELLGISPETVHRDWKFSQAFLLRHMGQGG